MDKNEEEIEVKQPLIYQEREFTTVEGGIYNEEGFYITPNGSFWDPDLVYFNREGYDRHEGFYDENYEYNPGRGWIPHLCLYEDELNEKQQTNLADEIEGIDELDYDNVDDLHDEIDYDNLAEEKKKEECIIKKKVLVFTGENSPFSIK